MKLLKKISLIILVTGYLVAGINHFLHPQSYYRIIPHYLPLPVLLNALAGIFEILFAILILRPKTRKVASYGIILMLIGFLPVHITMLIDAPLKLGNLLVTPAISCIRLLFQPILILWTWWHRR